MLVVASRRRNLGLNNKHVIYIHIYKYTGSSSSIWEEQGRGEALAAKLGFRLFRFVLSRCLRCFCQRPLARLGPSVRHHRFFWSFDLWWTKHRTKAQMLQPKTGKATLRVENNECIQPTGGISRRRQRQRCFGRTEATPGGVGISFYVSFILPWLHLALRDMYVLLH